MALNLTRQLAAAHAPRAPRSAPAARAPDEWSIRPAHVTFDRGSGSLIFAALERLPVRRFVPDVVLACAGGGDGPGDEAGAFVQEALRRGAAVSPPGGGRCEALYRDRYGAPGRVVIACGDPPWSAGALGMLTLSCGALETAAVLAGGGYDFFCPGVLGIELRGGFGPWVGGNDLALELLRVVDPSRRRGRIVELWGAGVKALAMGDRLAVASRADALGARAVVFPSDEATRGYLAARGREADWKSLECDPDAEFEDRFEIELDRIEPLMAPLQELESARPLRYAVGMAVSRVALGPHATEADLARFVRALGGAAAAETTEVFVIPGSRRMLQARGASETLESLIRAGARVLESDALPQRTDGLAPSSAGLCFGLGMGEAAGRGIRWYAASLEACAAAARVGRVVDPRELGADPTRPAETEHPALEDGRLLKPPPESELEPSSAPGAATRSALFAARPLDGPLRGTVLLASDDRIGADRILPWGARLAPHLADIERLADHVMAPLDRDFARRARVHRGGFVIAGPDFGWGVAREQVALALAALGVRAVLAQSFAEPLHQRLIQAGVLPLGRPRGGETPFAAGDELEIPGLPETLLPGKPLVVRNLTRGTQAAVSHALSEREIAVTRFGGLLAYAATLLPGPERAPA